VLSPILKSLSLSIIRGLWKWEGQSKAARITSNSFTFVVFFTTSFKGFI